MSLRTGPSFFITTCLTAGLLSTPLPANAAGADPWSFKVSPGYSIPIGPSTETIGGGMSVSGTVEYQINEWVRSGLEVGYSRQSKRGTSSDQDLDGDGMNDTVDFTSDMHAKFIHATPVVEIGHVLPFAGIQWRPYVMTGCGVYRIYSDAGNYFLTGTTTGGATLNAYPVPTPAASGTAFGIQVGVGLEVPLSRHTMAGVSFQYHQILEPDSDDRLIIPSGYIGYRF